MKRHTASLVKVKVVKTSGKTIARSSENYSKPGWHTLQYIKSGWCNRGADFSLFQAGIYSEYKLVQKE